ncbi:MAG: ribonuclease III [Chloroflexota bacterium]
MADLSVLEARLGVSLSDPSGLELSLVHSSYVNENPALAPASNERLEFLGDAVLGLAVAEELYRLCPQCPEGELTRLRSALVRRDTLARVAAEVGLGDYLYLGKGEEAHGGRQKPANLASALEAVIAAVFLDQGLATAREFVLRRLHDEIGRAVQQGAEIDYKSRLQEMVQARQQPAPTYHLLAAEGPDHDRCFTVEVRLNEAVLGRGTGKSKKAAETEAARMAWQKLADTFTA